MINKNKSNDLQNTTQETKAWATRTIPWRWPQVFRKGCRQSLLHYPYLLVRTIIYTCGSYTNV
jgi:hypothetical protein